jgi:hypothetical protein
MDWNGSGHCDSSLLLRHSRAFGSGCIWDETVAICFRAGVNEEDRANPLTKTAPFGRKSARISTGARLLTHRHMDTHFAGAQIALHARTHAHTHRQAIFLNPSPRIATPGALLKLALALHLHTAHCTHCCNKQHRQTDTHCRCRRPKPTDTARQPAPTCPGSRQGAEGRARLEINSKAFPRAAARGQHFLYRDQPVLGTRRLGGTRDAGSHGIGDSRGPRAGHRAGARAKGALGIHRLRGKATHENGGASNNTHH